MRSPVLIRQWAKPLIGLTLLGPVFWADSAAPLWGAFQFFSTEARPLGMGNAFSAVANDSSAAVFNPAGLTQLSRPLLSTQFTELISGLNDNASIRMGSAGFYSPLRGGSWGTAGFSFSSYRASSLAKEEIFSASYARAFSFEGFEGLSWGMNLKGLRREYASSAYSSQGVTNAGVVTSNPDPVFQNGRDASAFGVDLGALARFGDKGRYQAGISASNINRPSVGLRDKDDKADSIWRSGLAYMGDKTIFSTEYRQASRLSRKDQEGAIGVERQILNQPGLGATLRGGYERGSRRLEGWSLGFSVLAGLVRFDYGYQFKTGLLSDTGAGHRIGVVFAFPAGASAEKPVKLARSGAASPETDGPTDWREKIVLASHLNPEEKILFNFITEEKYSTGAQSRETWSQIKDPVIEKINTPNYGFAYAALEYWRLGRGDMAIKFLSHLKGPEKDNGFLAALYALCVWDAMTKTNPEARDEFKRNERRALKAHFENPGEVYFMLAELLSEPAYSKKGPSYGQKAS